MEAHLLVSGLRSFVVRYKRLYFNILRLNGTEGFQCLFSVQSSAVAMQNQPITAEEASESPVRSCGWGPAGEMHPGSRSPTPVLRF